jgi:hypothetical protein
MTQPPIWKRLTLEAVVIVASILLAFAIDAWWDGRQDSARRIALLSALQTDFRAAEAGLVRSVEVEGNLLRRTEALLIASGDQTRLSQDSIRSLSLGLVAAGPAVPPTPLYDAAVSSGDIGLIESDSLLVFLGRFQVMRERHEDIAAETLTQIFRGRIDDLRRELGSIAVLNGGGVWEPPARFVPEDLNVIVHQKTFYSAAEVMFVARLNSERITRRMLDDVRGVLTVLDELLDEG